MSGTVISINLSPKGGVPKLPVPRATIKIEGIEGEEFGFDRTSGEIDF